MTTKVFIEAGRKRAFASALDWPGWCRSGRTEDLALAALADYLPRYALVVHRAGLTAPLADVEVAGRSPGYSALADFGALGISAQAEYQALTATEGQRLAALLEAAWAELAEAAAEAPAVLPKGPRGGGRDTGPILEHVVETEIMHAAKLGLRPGKVRADDADAVATLRSAIVEAIRHGAAGDSAHPGGWPARYAIRRTGWHVLDHAWELQDKTGPAVR